MITAPLADPKPGMILFSDHLALMVRVTKITDTGFRFRVLNGAWDGVVEEGRVRIQDGSYRAFDKTYDRNADDPDTWLGNSDFAEVLSVTAEEYHAWYLIDAPGAARLVNRPVVAEPVLVSPEPDKDGEDGPDPVHETTLLVTVLGQGDSPKAFESWISGLSLEDLACELDEGELIGASRVVGTSEIPPGEVRARLEEVGNDGTFFEGVAPAGTSEPVSSRISAVRDQQGWNDGSMEHLAAAFIREAGLERAFLAHLEAQAAEENAYSDEPGIM